MNRRDTRAFARQNPPPRGGFTLVEMLVVVVIIAILAGMVLGLFKVAGSWGAKSQTNERLGKVRAAIEEFYAEYAKYPPVSTEYNGQPFGYEYPITNGWADAVVANIASHDPAWSTAPVFTFGLMSFLVPRYTDHAANISQKLGWNVLFNLNQWTAYNFGYGGSVFNDQPRDLNAINRWKTHLEGVATFDHPAHIYGTLGYTNALLTVKDGWGNELHYESLPPHTHYKLWSDGPSTSTTADDISTGAGY